MKTKRPEFWIVIETSTSAILDETFEEETSAYSWLRAACADGRLPGCVDDYLVESATARGIGCPHSCPS